MSSEVIKPQPVGPGTIPTRDAPSQPPTPQADEPAKSAKSANSNIIIRCVDADAILARLPEDVKALAKVYDINKTYLKDRYNTDTEFREKHKSRNLLKSNQKYADDPEFRAKRAEQARAYYARKKVRERNEMSDVCV